MATSTASCGVFGGVFRDNAFNPNMPPNTKILNDGVPVFTFGSLNLRYPPSSNPSFPAVTPLGISAATRPGTAACCSYSPEDGFTCDTKYAAVSLTLLNHTGLGTVSLYLSPDPLGATYQLGPNYVLDCTSPAYKNMSSAAPYIPWNTALANKDFSGADYPSNGPLYAFAKCTGSISCGLNFCGCAACRRGSS